VTEGYKFVCVHVLDGAQPAIDKDGDALCLPCYKRGWPEAVADVRLVPRFVYDKVVGGWGLPIRVGV